MTNGLALSFFYPPHETPNGRGTALFMSALRQQHDNKSSEVAEMGDRLATIDMGRKVGDCCAPFMGRGQPGPKLTQCRLGQGLPPYQVAS